ncbi:MAG: CHRD domain-containing protein [Blastocatellia bacterium]
MTLTKNFSVMVLTLLCVFALSAIAKADTVTLTATLSAANEVPPKDTNTFKGTGTATVVVDTVTGKVTVTVNFSGLSGAYTGGHIHCCAAPGSNAGIIVPFDAFLTGPADKLSGSLTNYSPATPLTAAQIAGLLNGQAYVNIHTAANPGGEIRGQLTAVPEPGTLLLLGAGLVSVAARLRKRRDQDV